eukprot:CAMPEP_0206492154 /NCGR_PEP_ID=MMETSP0324_2-20121206/45762_1 /ASSEMBLY_ACC=CAM_ASM_000836 /TAXON_ID=2866 /ORGANISM="Crypthecodinium cohnii, Strain Seligo" /LENGTH=599 /DNA_ID=CAMNT_0053974161 /DNA_START=199 /DNA_END=1994 /DNA_ORIENTATION=+
MPETSIADVRVPLPWEEAKQHVELCKEKATRQFLALWKNNKDRNDEALKWGEEVEYYVVDLQEGGAKAALRADEILRALGSETGGEDPTKGAGWRTEYGNMMIEGVTHPPFDWGVDSILQVEPALRWRREELARVVKDIDPTLDILTLAAFPLLGVPNCTSPHAEPSPDGQISKSLMCPDEVTSPHPRYQTFTANYVKRKGCKVGAFIPRDNIKPEQRLTPEQVVMKPFELDDQGSRERDPVPGYIYIDSQAFGGGQCCMQATFLAPNLEDARFLTDQFLVLGPLFLALSAATPFVRGCVAETDTRWPTFNQSWDDRSRSEIGALCNSRCSANDYFISDWAAAQGANDKEVPFHEASLQTLLKAGVDETLSRHAAHVLSRDPLMVFDDRLDIDDEKESDQWEQIHGTNWGSVRFKPPPCKGGIGWRVEFRTPDVQLTDYENAAIVAVIRLLTQVILEEKWQMVIPISLCDANDDVSSSRKAASDGLYWFSESFLSGSAELSTKAVQAPLREILGGPHGLFTRLRTWLDAPGRCSPESRKEFEAYLHLFERRASGSLPTPATFMRSLLSKHGSYTGDSNLPIDFVHELCKLAVRAAGERP